MKGLLLLDNFELSSVGGRQTAFEAQVAVQVRGGRKLCFETVRTDVLIKGSHSFNESVPDFWIAEGVLLSCYWAWRLRCRSACSCVSSGESVSFMM
jgi:hypothetical protein